jgi:hypothetical protein
MQNTLQQGNDSCKPLVKWNFLKPRRLYFPNDFNGDRVVCRRGPGPGITYWLHGFHSILFWKMKMRIFYSVATVSAGHKILSIKQSSRIADIPNLGPSFYMC